MKKAEELAIEYERENYNDLIGSPPTRYSFKAGYLAALSSQTDKVRMLLDENALLQSKILDLYTAIWRHEDEMDDPVFRKLYEIVTEQITLKSYQTDEGERE